MKPIKKDNGKWRVTIYDYKDAAGKVHQKTFTADTRREVLRLATEYKERLSEDDMTIAECVKGYIKLKNAVLSPSTSRSYDSIYRTHFAESRFGSTKLSKLKAATVQNFISSLDLSPKTVRNIYGLLTASVNMYRPEFVFNATLPTGKRPQLHTPTTDEIAALMDYVKKDRELYICLLLCVFGAMRRSEACAVHYDDIVDNTITIRRARVYNSNKEWIYKDYPKTDSSYRTVICPSEVIKAIGKGFGYVIGKSTPAALSDRMSRALTAAGLQHFRMHDLRHYTASIMHAIGVPDQYIMQRGGWKTDNVMKRVYRNALSDVDKQMADKTNDYLMKLVT